MKEFKRGTPESVGIASATIQTFLDYIESAGIELHSFAVYRHGKVCSAGAYKPYRSDTVHLMYSAAKSVTSIAVGFAEQEGLLSLEEKLSDIFAEEMDGYDYADNPHLRQATVEHLLTMSCGHTEEIDPYKNGWIRAFLTHTTPCPPGEHFFYNTPGVNLLVAIVRKRSRQSLTEFLRTRLFEPLGMGNGVRYDSLADGTEIGGGGLFWSTDDFMRFALFLLQRGRFDGRQLLSESWFDRACTKQIATPVNKDGRGYGYLFWMGPDGSFQCSGMLGQYALILPKKDAFIVTTANGTLFPEATNNQDRLLDSLYRILVSGMEDKTLPENPVEQELLTRRLQGLSLPALRYSYSPLGPQIQGRRYCPAEPIPLDCFLGYGFLNASPIHGKHISALYFEPLDGDLCLVLEAEDTVTIPLGTHSAFLDAALWGETVSACARWRSTRCLELEIRMLEGILGIRYLFRFAADGGSFAVEGDPIQAFDFSAKGTDITSWTFFNKE